MPVRIKSVVGFVGVEVGVDLHPECYINSHYLISVNSNSLFPRLSYKCYFCHCHWFRPGYIVIGFTDSLISTLISKKRDFSSVLQWSLIAVHYWRCSHRSLISCLSFEVESTLFYSATAFLFTIIFS